MTSTSSKVGDVVRPPSDPGHQGTVDRGGFADQVQRIRAVAARVLDGEGGGAVALPGEAFFLPDGRILCGPRQRGDSRYPYGRGGFNFWAYASGKMHCNDGRYFVFRPPADGEEPPIAFLAGLRRAADQPFCPLSLLPVPFVEPGESRIMRRYAVIGPEAAYYVTELADVSAAVRVCLEPEAEARPAINFSLLVANRGGESVDLYLSAFMNPFCRHQFVATNEDRWFKRIEVQRADTPLHTDNDNNAPPSRSPAPFVVAVNEDASRFRSVTNHALVRRALSACRLQGDVWVPVGLQVRGEEPSRPGDAGLVPGGRPSLGSSQVCTSRTAYLGGQHRGLGQAAFLADGRFEKEVPSCVFNDIAVVGDLHRFTLPPDTMARADYVLTLPEDAAALDSQVAVPIAAAQVDQAHNDHATRLAEAGHDLELEATGSSLAGICDLALNRFFPYLKKQVAVCALMKGYMHPAANSLIGFRDVFQALEAFLLDRPDLARAKMLEALAYVLPDGRCPRQYSLTDQGGSAAADLREFIDQGNWVVSAVHTYLRTTGDPAFLDEMVGYHEIGPHAQAALRPADESDTVLDHLCRIMNYLDRHRDPATGLVRAMYGDWNDALDGLGVVAGDEARFGTGVSVMASLHTYRNCAEMVEILSRSSRDDDKQAIDRYGRLRSELREGLLRFAIVQRDEHRRIVHGWGDERSYFVGSFSDSDGLARDGLTSNAFWILSEMIDATPELREEILAAFERLDSPRGLKTFEPGFASDAPGVGRIPKLPIGTAENAATYVHATAFGIRALFRAGEPRRAWDQIVKILPFAPHHANPSHSPFVMSNSYVHNPELGLDGQSMNDWQTGCSNVLLKALIRDAFGLDPDFESLRIGPAGWVPFQKYQLRAKVHGIRIRIEYTRGNGAQRSFRVNGVRWTDVARDGHTGVAVATIPYGSLQEGEENRIQIIDPEQSSD